MKQTLVDQPELKRAFEEYNKLGRKRLFKIDLLGRDFRDARRISPG